MDKEVESPVLAIINEKRLLGEKRTPVDILLRMGVSDARDKASEHVWLAAGDRIVLSLWAERIGVGASGRWFYLESLVPQLKVGGGERSALQIQRVKDRIQMLRRALDSGEGLRAVLQTNRVASTDIENDKAARVSVRVPDDEDWHVAGWHPEHKLAVLVRGPRGWVPAPEEVQTARARIGLPDLGPAAAATDGAPVDVQSAALDYLARHFAGYGYAMEHASIEESGYDAEVRDKKGNVLLKLVVRGTGGGVVGFQLSAAERQRGREDARWRLAVVTDAATPAAQHKLYNGGEVEKAPGLEPLLT